MLRTTIGLLALAGALSSACERASEQARTGTDSTAWRARDDMGRAVQLSAPPRRVISLMPAVTDMIIALGAADRLIARTEWDTAAVVRHLPSTGNALTPSLEWLVSMKPDLIVAWPDAGSRSVIGQLEKMNLPVYAARTESVADALRTARHLGRLLGIPERADSVANGIRQELDRLHARVASARPVSVAYILSVEPPMIAGPGTFIGELIRVAGGENSFAELNALWPQVSMEELIKRQPEALVVTLQEGADPRSRLKAMPGWRELPAVKNDRMLLADPDLFNRAGPNLPSAAHAIARLLHPERVR